MRGRARASVGAACAGPRSPRRCRLTRRSKAGAKRLAPRDDHVVEMLKAGRCPTAPRPNVSRPSRSRRFTRLRSTALPTLRLTVSPKRGRIKSADGASAACDHAGRTLAALDREPRRVKPAALVRQRRSRRAASDAPACIPAWCAAPDIRSWHLAPEARLTQTGACGHGPDGPRGPCGHPRWRGGRGSHGGACARACWVDRCVSRKSSPVRPVGRASGFQS